MLRYRMLSASLVDDEIGSVVSSATSASLQCPDWALNLRIADLCRASADKYARLSPLALLPCCALLCCTMLTCV